MKQFILIFILMLSLTYGMSQSNIFHDIGINKTYQIRENKGFRIAGSWKHLYNEPAWRRWGASGTGYLKFNNGLSLEAGFGSWYTFNRNIDNFFELRPSLAVKLHTRLSEKWNFNQKFSGEWRYFNFHTADRENSYGRLRYGMGADYLLSENEEENTEWKLKLWLEWYFLKEPDSGERYANLRESTLKLERKMKNSHSFTIGFRTEQYSQLIPSDDKFGYLLVLEYDF